MLNNIMLLLVVFILCPVTFSKAVLEDPTEDALQQPCGPKCGCDNMYVYDAFNDRCMYNYNMKRVVVFYDSDNDEILADDEIAKSIYNEGENIIFKGITISVILFMICASICVVSSCIYCCRINYTDRTLKKNVEALAKKLKTDYKSKKIPTKCAPLPPLAKSCNVVIEPAGVFVA